MERRNRSLKALKELQYIDSLELLEKADALLLWVNNYLSNNLIENFDLEINDLKKLSELFYKNLVFIKEFNSEIRGQLDSHRKIREFLI